MPVYFFDLHNDLDVIDDEGKDFPDFEAALRHGVNEARAMIAAHARQGRIELRHNITIRDEDAVLHVLEFEDVVTVQRGGQPLTRPLFSVSRPS